MFTAALLTAAKIWKPPTCISADERIKKMENTPQWNTAAAAAKSL